MSALTFFMHNILFTAGVNSNSFCSQSRRHSGLARQHTYSTVLSYLQMYGSCSQWGQTIFEVALQIFTKKV